MSIAVVGSGISGLAAAWLLSREHAVTVIEAAGRVGGHSYTAELGVSAVDMGFIVYNEDTYPNLSALFTHLGIATAESDMSFSVSIDNGRFEYAGTTLDNLFAQRRNIVSLRFWSMMRDLARFYRCAPRDIPGLRGATLDQYLDRNGYGDAFRRDHLYPMAAAIWSAPAGDVGSFPAAALIRFFDNHGLLKFRHRPVWRTVAGGSCRYVTRLASDIRGRFLIGHQVRRIVRGVAGVAIDVDGIGTRVFDHVVIATHADQALGLLADPSELESELLGSFSYNRARVVLHQDPSLMPRRRKIWSSWNYIGGRPGQEDVVSITYWMNRLQGIPADQPLFVTLNPRREPAAGSVIEEQEFEHPAFDLGAACAQARLWSLQGQRNSWFCGAYFGAGFHEDGLQAGLAVAEQLGGVRRPWTVGGESDRIAPRMAGIHTARSEAPW